MVSTELAHQYFQEKVNSRGFVKRQPQYTTSVVESARVTRDAVARWTSEGHARTARGPCVDCATCVRCATGDRRPATGDPRPGDSAPARAYPLITNHLTLPVPLESRGTLVNAILFSTRGISSLL